MRPKQVITKIMVATAISLIALASCSSGSGDGPKGESGADATLKSLTVSAGTLTPAFSPTRTEYTVNLETSQTTLTVTGVATDANATVGGKSGAAQTIKAGETAIVVSVTGSDGKTTKDYTVKANRKPNVYTAGRLTENGKTYASFWKNAERTLLDIGDSTSGVAEAITVANGTVYAAGYCYETIGGSSVPVPCYWTGTTRTKLAGDGTHEAYAFAIAVDGGNVYAAGYYSNGTTKIPCYWKNENRIDLPGIYYEAIAISISGGKVYVAGFEYDGNDPCYWINGDKTSLGNSGLTNTRPKAMIIDGNDIYIGGRANNGSSYVPCLWVNGARTLLPLGSATSINVSGMAVMNGKAYICGQGTINSKDTACYWADSTNTALSDSNASETDANCITSFNGTLYTGGRANVSLPYTACYWIGTTRVDLSTSYSEVNAIFVGD